MRYIIPSLLPKADVFIIKSFLPKEIADQWYKRIRDESEWVFMEYINNPRIPETETNTYFTTPRSKDQSIHRDILTTMRRVSRFFKIPLSTYAINYYPDEKYGLFYHGDDDCIGDTFMSTLSLGGTRRLWFLDLETKEELPIIMESGDLVIMGKDSQFKYWHGLKPDLDFPGGRIALPFRYKPVCPCEKDL